jgi:hypothetical protein
MNIFGQFLMSTIKQCCGAGASGAKTFSGAGARAVNFIQAPVNSVKYVHVKYCKILNFFVGKTLGISISSVAKQAPQSRITLVKPEPHHAGGAGAASCWWSQSRSFNGMWLRRLR